ncbi:hypothetical protein HAX54_025066 [Datura stramonium]|uniref:Uncharacterized protein n=1 Tax=Datura stramonium TaxID=4076 RepID=A0ABS8S6D1_DATST|nr:hypothetical protein [Datura stramonium]
MANLHNLLPISVPADRIFRRLNSNFDGEEKIGCDVAGAGSRGEWKRRGGRFGGVRVREVMTSRWRWWCLAGRWNEGEGCVVVIGRREKDEGEGKGRERCDAKVTVRK